MHCYVHFPPAHDVEAYTNAILPIAETSSTLFSYSDACWGSQIGSAVSNRTLFPLFKFQSMSGSIIFRNGGPLGWLSKCQEHTSLSSCKAEIWAMNESSKKIINFWHLCALVILFLTPQNQLFSTMITTPVSNDHII